MYSSASEPTRTDCPARISHGDHEPVIRNRAAAVPVKSPGPSLGTDRLDLGHARTQLTWRHAGDRPRRHDAEVNDLESL